MYKKVGFKISYMSPSGATKNMTTCVSKNVYKKLYAVKYSRDVAEEMNYSPTEICSVSKYFKACTITNIGAKNFSTEFVVTPFWVTMDGSCVYGEPVVKSISQYLEPVK